MNKWQADMYYLHEPLRGGEERAWGCGGADRRQQTEGGWTSITTSAALNTDPDVEVEPWEATGGPQFSCNIQVDTRQSAGAAHHERSGRNLRDVQPSEMAQQFPATLQLTQWTFLLSEEK